MTHDVLDVSTQRLVRTIDSLPDDAYPAPSLLPGWTRGHVVAHLALNAEALAGALRGVVEGRPVPMYGSPEGRDADIESLAAASPSALRDRLLASTTVLGEALRHLPADSLDTEIERTPHGPGFAAGDVMAMRWREVEIHHVDLDAGYTRADWPATFAEVLVSQLAQRAGATLVATDLDQTWQADGDDDDATPRVSGTAADLGWWLTGRGDGDGLTTDGELPRIGAW
ncbi:maleylpyruvate isomerase family mycothiol-dependent enzyme [Nocardioides dongxiaopingii]|uniref:maleylpyruvate isomerase family mycothiol-dependent enzyme n=1 Tax=Nocardioides dongxiaopingii TaxID=2576036 RepID=UPI00148511BE|nr:maleylpyruvate isomerase family mycothiol-dependent enzyme [Nocardioides dongxiaopingii]